MPEIYVIPNFMKVVRAVLEIYECCVHGQIDSQTTRFFYKVETYLDPFRVLEIHLIPNLEKIVRAVFEIENVYIPTYLYTILARLIISGDGDNCSERNEVRLGSIYIL